MKNHRARALALLMLLVALAAPAARPARAAAIVGSGSPASCSEAALVAALAAGGSVSFNCGGPATITLTSQKSLVTSVTLEGAGQITISGGDATRLFIVNGGVNLTLSNITLTRGRSAVGGGAIEATGAQVVLRNARITDSSATDQGGAIYCFVGTGGTLSIVGSTISGNRAAKGSGVYNDGCAMTVSDSLIVNNRNSAGFSFGGGIYTAGPLSVDRSTLSGNQAFDGGGLYVAAGERATISGSTISGNTASYGAGIESSGALTVTDSLISQNSATSSGGGIWNMSGSLRVARSSVSGNSAGEGGGISSYGNSVSLTDVNISGNSASGASGGGGIYHSAGTIFVTNGTISGNRASSPDGSGGGIYQSSDDNLTLTNVTLSGNAAGRFGGGLYHRARYAILTNVTIGGNTAQAGSAIYEDAAVTPAAPGVIQIVNSAIFGHANNCEGALFVSNGHNVSAGGCASLIGPTDRVGLGDVGLGPLANNGGAFAMATHAPLAGSPLIDAGDPANCPTRDQRGAARVGVCDIGAVEYGPRLPLVYMPLVVR